MSHTRTKRGRTSVVSPPVGKSHGRLMATTPAVRRRVDPGDPAERLAYALIERHLFHRGIGTSSERAIKARIDRAREELRERDGGADEARQITVGLTANGGALLRSVEGAAVESRDYAARAAVRFVAYLREHKVETTAAVVQLASSAQWSALGEMLRDKCFAAKSGEAKALGASVKLAATCASAARLDLLGGLQLEREARDAKPAPAWPWLPAASEPSASIPIAQDAPSDGDDPEVDPNPVDDSTGALDALAPESGESSTGSAPHDAREGRRGDHRVSMRESGQGDEPVYPVLKLGPLGFPMSAPSEEAIRSAWSAGMKWDNSRWTYVPREGSES